ncbi:MAG TPA: hypothetical protein VHA55_05800 [Pseudorhodoplanes sp.]|nr:hypothetical protein [Pseudorhodoplanes sp.]
MTRDIDFLPGLPIDRILACYAGAPGKEIESGKLASRESSAALVANAFGYFLGRATKLPLLPGCADLGAPANDEALDLEVLVRFPWSGGRHPCLDAIIETETALIGVESKRFEPFRPRKMPSLSEAYWRPLWGEAMRGYEAIRDGLGDETLRFEKLDAAQLVKHALGLRTAIHTNTTTLGKRPVLFYVYAEPATWPDGKAIVATDLQIHRAEIARFAAAVAGDEVRFASASYRELLATWLEAQDQDVRAHAAALAARFNL